jgi:catechol 2,3-dioxygenase-like lactoylglutathione lyase family enzyme
MRVREILECCLYVNDLDAAEAFYRDVLGLEVLGRQPGRHVFFHCGQRMLLLFDPRGSDHVDSELPRHGMHGAGHVAFAVYDHELEAWQHHLDDRGIPIEQAVDWPQGGRSLYFRDPAGNSLEITTPRIWGLDVETCIRANGEGRMTNGE